MAVYFNSLMVTLNFSRRNSLFAGTEEPSAGPVSITSQELNGWKIRRNRASVRLDATNVHSCHGVKLT